MRDLLIASGQTHLTHAVFSNNGRLIVVDFFLSDSSTVIECWRTDARRGVALGWMERNAAFIDVKFRRLKALNPSLRCIAFAEAPKVDRPTLEKIMAEVLPHADWVVHALDELHPAITCGSGN